MQCMPEGARGRVPQANGIIPGGADEGLAVGTKGYAVDTPRMAFQCVPEGA